MDIKEKIKVLSPVESYIQGVFAFPSAYVEAKWGTTGYIHCVKDEGLYDHIVENKRSRKLTKEEIDGLSQAFLALATMDKGFGSNNK
jgi:hypothetical protein